MHKKTDKELIDTKLAILPIGSVAQSLGIHQRTLRIYDKEGILSPTRSDKNRRTFSVLLREINCCGASQLIRQLRRKLRIRLTSDTVSTKHSSHEKTPLKILINSYFQIISIIP